MSEWQPIETAPLDGTAILVFDPDSRVEMKKIFIAEYRVEQYSYKSFSSQKTWIVQNTFDGEQSGEIEVNPTHWMPLPEFPEESK